MGPPFSGCKNIKATYKGKTYDYENLYRLYDAINLGESGMLIEDGVLKDVSRDLTELVIPNNVIRIEKHAFDGCTDLISITIGNGVTEIDEEYAFSGLTNLKSVTLPDRYRLGDYAFAGCENLTSIAFPYTVNFNGYGFSRQGFFRTIEGSNIQEVIFDKTSYSLEEFCLQLIV